MLDFTDFTKRKIKEDEEKKAQHAEQRKFQRQVAVVMSEVKSDPRWKVYADHVQAKYEQHLALAHAAKEKLGDPFTFFTTEENGKLKLLAAYNQGKAEGFKSALTIIEDLIDRGKEPEPLDAEEKSA